MVDLIIILAFVVFKTIFFIRVTRHRSFSRWLYFSHFDIVNSMTEFAEREKKRQNKLSVILVFLIIVSAAAFYWLRKKE